MINSKYIKEQADKQLIELQDLIEQLPDKGDTEETSQKIVLINNLNSLWYAFNGLSQEDCDE